MKSSFVLLAPAWPSFDRGIAVDQPQASVGVLLRAACFCGGRPRERACPCPPCCVRDSGSSLAGRRHVAPRSLLARCAGSMLFAKLSVISFCASFVGATPVVNVIVEPPLGGLDSSSGASKLESALADVQGLARSVRDGSRTVGVRAQSVLQAQPVAASFVTLGGASADASYLASLLTGVASSVGAPATERLSEGSFEIPDAEVDIRKRLFEASGKFSEASGATSFLQPVDANRLRGSLRATEPMLASPPLAVNVVMAEDVAGMQQAVAQHVAAEQLAALKGSFESDLLALEAL